MSAGIRSGVNWMRENVSDSVSASVRTSIVLPRPGTPSSSAWPPASMHVRTPSTTSRLPTIDFAISARSVVDPLAEERDLLANGFGLGHRRSPWLRRVGSIDVRSLTVLRAGE